MASIAANPVQFTWGLSSLCSSKSKAPPNLTKLRRQSVVRPQASSFRFPPSTRSFPSEFPCNVSKVAVLSSLFRRHQHGVDRFPAPLSALAADSDGQEIEVAEGLENFAYLPTS